MTALNIVPSTFEGNIVEKKTLLMKHNIKYKVIISMKCLMKYNDEIMHR